MNKNILHVVNIYFVLPYFIGDQFKYFKEKGYNMNVVCSPSEYLSDYAQKQGFEYIESPVNRNISISQDFVSIRNICKFVKKQKIDIVVGHTPKGGLLAMIAGWLMRVPIRIYVRHGLVYETSKGLKRFILMSVDRLASFCSTKVVCVSPSVLRKSIEDHLAPAKKQMIWHKGTCNGIDTLNHFNPAVIVPARLADLKARYGIGEEDFVIGYSGRLVRDKGIIELVRAFDKLQLADNCKLLLVGMFEKRDALPEDIQERILNDSRIIYTGFINGGMEYFYSMMDIYVLASYREGFPTGVLEAQAMEKPVITTRVTGCCDSIIDGRTGFFVNNTAEDIAEKIDKIRLDKAIDGCEGRKWVIENFDSRLVWKEIEKLYV
ncbi:glycosyltransferase family 4 protein [Bacteroides stercorirosoris]|uniref:Glycosyltransferase family 1 protein n=1 Tax=Bacteroides stercorirosoris TaxID=871324 RepID=A0A1M6LZ84_9BACE|nr:glycosyltransferase family 4 protein [Bacteroides stercorirosoris]RGX79997.1 glycosyltransferase family 1 protein [Bacteroides stercorirosoris]SHJ76496.1 Glycosyltransferase involved in cell wall bisynthesis [Bacteroides stercorirosoris]